MFIKATVLATRINEAGSEYLLSSPFDDNLPWKLSLPDALRKGQTLALEVKVVGTDGGSHLVVPMAHSPYWNVGWVIPVKHVHETLQPCGNHNCSVSTGICESLTYGSGELDQWGYWEFPCSTCARAAEIRHPEYGSCWPFANTNKEKV